MRPMLRMRSSLGVLALVLAFTFAFAACGGDSSSDGEENHDDEAAQVEGDEHEEVEGEEQEEADESAYLEAAPKDALYLVEMTSFAYAPAVLEVNVGEVLEIAVQNAEPVLHDFTIDEIDADVHVSYLGGTGQHLHTEPQNEADVHFALTEPGTGVVHLKVHEPGEYVFYCTVPGHQEAGMEGTLIVR